MSQKRTAYLNVKISIMRNDSARWDRLWETVAEIRRALAVEYTWCVHRKINGGAVAVVRGPPVPTFESNQLLSQGVRLT